MTMQTLEKIRRWTIVTLISVVFLGVCVFFVNIGIPLIKFSKSYDELRFGMSRDETRELFRAPPDFVCRYKTYDIWYYISPDPHAGDLEDFRIEQNAIVQSLDELPDVYACLQLAFDAEGRLHAYTFIGESDTAKSVNGEVEGSNISRLPSSAFP